jgi:hypothetical protein
LKGKNKPNQLLLEVNMSGKNFVGWVIARTIGVLILLSLIGGAGYMAYSAGVAQGIAQAPEVAEAIQQQGVPVAPMAGYGYPHGFGYHHFNPFGAICFSIFFLFLFFGLLKMIFFRSWHHGGWRGPWGRKWEGGAPPMFDEWHKRAHGEAPSDSDTSKTET